MDLVARRLQLGFVQHLFMRRIITIEVPRTFFVIRVRIRRRIFPSEYNITSIGLEVALPVSPASALANPATEKAFGAPLAFEAEADSGSGEPPCSP